MKSKTLLFTVAMLAIVRPVFAQEKMADVDEIEARIGKDWATMSKGLEGFDLIRTRLKDNRVTISQGRAKFYLQGDVAEAIYHQMGGKLVPEDWVRCTRGLAKSLPEEEGGLGCVKLSSKESGKTEYLCEMDVDLRTGRLSYEDEECEDENQEELDRIQDKKGTKFPRLPSHN
ncbi:MAG: hypothetical protein LBK55_02520 [Azoarcus sp.]|nr:hypothetical protein [Azoarcus sp.]